MKNWFRKDSTTLPAERLAEAAPTVKAIRQAPPPIEVPDAPFDTYLHGKDVQFYLDTRTTRTSKQTILGAIDLNGEHLTTRISETEAWGIAHHLAIPPRETVKLRYGKVLLEFMRGNRPRVSLRFVAEDGHDNMLASVCLVGDELYTANRMFLDSCSMNCGRDNRLCTSMIFDLDIEEPMWPGGPARVAIYDDHVQ